MGKNTKWYVLGVVLSIPAYFGIKSLFNHNKESGIGVSIQTPSASRNEVLSIRAIVVQPQSLQEEITISGTILPDEEVSLCFETSGKITEILFEEGARVKKGKLLVEFDMDAIKKEGYDLITPVVVTNISDYIKAVCMEKEDAAVNAGDKFLTIV